MMDDSTWNASTLIRLSGKFWEICTLHAAVELDIFSAIGDSQLSATQISGKLDTHPEATERLLNALTAMKFVAKSENAYSNTLAARKYLIKNSPDYVGYIILHHRHLVDSWSKLDITVKSGEPLRNRSSIGDESVRESFLMGMFNLAWNLAPRLIPYIDLSGCQHLLDLGGGPGTYAIQFCLKYPQLKATVFDLPTTRIFAEKTIANFNLSHRIQFIGGDYGEDQIPGRYDVAWLSHILHSENPQDCKKLIQKAVSVLEPGGTIIIHDFILNNAMDGPLQPALFSLNMLLGVRGGRSYSQMQLTEMLTNQGVKNIRRIPIPDYEDSGIIIGNV
jgi:SAM-dependent methyltransferase